MTETKHAITVKEARAVLLAAQEAEYEAKQAANEKYIGRCYRYRNSYSGEGPKWWMYGICEKAEPHYCTGMRFQRKPDGNIEIERDAMISPEGGGWEKISARHFWAAASKISLDVLNRLSPPSQRGSDV